MHDLFHSCRSLTSLDVSNFDTSNVKNMGYMFVSCYRLTSLDVSNWDVSKVTDMNNLFYDCNKLTSLDVSNWDTSSATVMGGMFRDCNALTSLDVSNFDTSKVTDMSYMFYDCYSLTSLDVSKWDTSNLTDIEYMFNNCNRLTSLDVSNWDTRNLQKASLAFYNCKRLAVIDVSRWKMNAILSCYRMFDACSGISKVDISNWELTYSSAHLYSLCSNTNITQFEFPDRTQKVRYIHHIFNNCVNLEVINFKDWDIYASESTTSDIEKYDIFGINIDNNKTVPPIKKIISNNLSTIKILANNQALPDKTGEVEPGYIVTTLRDQIDEETLAALTAKNWVVKDLVAQYKYDANTYENLLPEFNTEFTSDKYEIHDSISEGVITYNDVTAWHEDEINLNSNLITCLSNTTYHFIKGFGTIRWYDSNKNYIDVSLFTDGAYMTSPINARYMMIVYNKENGKNSFELVSKLVTRSIESKNGDLPTLMRFGHNGDSTDDQATYTGPATALLKVFAANTSELTTGERMFRYCKRVEEIRCSNWNTSNMTDMGSMFATASDYLTELDVSNLDVSNVHNISTMFWGCFKLTSLDVSNWDTSNVINMYGVFTAAYNLNNIIGIEDWDTSSVKVMNYMFSYCYILQSLDLSKWNVNNVTNMEMMFYDCTSLELLNLSNWDMSQVIYMNNMINNCNELNSIIMYNSNAVSINIIINQLPTRTEASKGALVIAGVDDRTLVNINVAESKFWIVKSRLVAKYKFNKSIYDNLIPNMGTDFTSYTVIDKVNPYNVNHITRMLVSDFAPQIMKFGTDGDDYTKAKAKALMEVIHVHMDNLRWCYNMFRGCQYATAINMKNVNTDLMTNMSCMFSMCYNITTLDVSSFNTSQITDMQYVFDDCNKLTEIKGLENWDVSNVTNFRAMFENCRVLTSLSDIYDWNVGKAESMTLMFQNCYKLTSLDLNNWDTGNVTTMDNMFCDCNKLTSLDVSNFDTSKVTRMDHMFEKCQSLTSLDVSNFNTINVTKMNSMFVNCNKLTSLDVSGFNTSKVTDMEYMFQYCESLTSLDVSNFDTSNVITMACMFMFCYSLTSLDVRNWDTSNVTNMGRVFEACGQLVNLDISRWNTGNVTNMVSLFANCYKLTSLDVSNFNTSKVTNMSSMFEDAGSTNNNNGLSVLNLSNFNFSKVTNAMWMLNGTDGQLKIKELNLNNLDLATISDIRDFIDSDYSNSIQNPRIISNNLNTINLLADMLPNRSTITTSGQIVTTIRDQIDEETMAALTAKNWIVKGSVAQYVYDANTYEDLIPEFNPEFTEDMYEVHDSVSEIVIDDIQWEPGGISETAGTDHNGINEEYPDRVRSGYLTVIPNIEYKFNVPYVHVYWYNENKQFISYDGMYGTNGGTTMKGNSCVAPIKAKYLRIGRGAGPYTMSITAKLVTRSIESKNGDLPTLMRFGTDSWDIVTDKSKSLLKIVDLSSNSLIIMTYMFNKCIRLTNVNTTNWDVSNVTYMYSMFFGCTNLTSLDVSNWDTSNVTNMGDLFTACQSLKSLDVSGWDTSKVTNMYQMFGDCINLTSLDVSNFDTSEVTSMNHMFNNCKSLTSLDVSNFDTSKITNMAYMFYNCTSLTSLDLSNFNTSNVTVMNHMFAECKKLTSLDVSNFNTSNVTDMGCMFKECNALTTVGNLSNWNTASVSYMNYMFYDCRKLASLEGIGGWNTAKVLGTFGMFYQCAVITSLDVAGWNTSNINTMGAMFQGCSSLSSLDVSHWNVAKVENMNGLFHACKALTTLDVSKWNTARLNKISREPGEFNEHISIFSDCINLTSLDLSNWNMSNVTNTRYMFYNCNNLTSLDVSKWDVSKVTDMAQMFSECKLLTSLDVSKWDVSKVTDMNNMFYNCQSLTSLDVLEWDTSSLRDITSLFYACSNLKSLDVSHWNVDNCGSVLGDITYSMRNTFNDTGLRVLNLSKWSKIEWLYDTLEDGRICNNFINSTVLKTIDFGNCVIPYYPVNWLKAPNLRYIKCDNGNSVSNLIEQVPTRTEAEPGYIITTAEISDDHKGLFNAKYWNIVKLDEVGTDIAIYKFNKSVYKSLVPVFDNNFADWFMDDVVEDEVNAPNIVTRTIRSMGGLPTKMIFGVSSSLGAYEDRSLSLLEVHKLNTSNITTMGQMFKRCTGVTMINTADWDVSNVTNMNELFFECAKITSLDVSNWDTRKVNNMSSIFIHCFKLQNIIGLNNWNTSNAQTMQWMFQDCQSLKSIDVSNWDTRKVNNMGSMFRYAISLESLDLSSFDTRAVTSMNCMFAGIDYGNYNPMSLTSITFGENWNTSNVQNFANMFYGCQSLTSLDVSKWDTSKATNIAGMFWDCRSLTSLDVSNFNTSKVTRTQGTFRNCRALEYIDVSKWNTSKVTDMQNMFYGCHSLISLDVSNFDTSIITEFDGMFAYCNKLRYLILGNWDTSNVKDMGTMFANNSGVRELDLSSWTCSAVTKGMGYMFRSCINLEYLDISNMIIPDTAVLTDLFLNITKLANIGMIYCDFKSVEKIASLVPTTNPTTIWVGNHIDINGLPQYDHITYKVYEVEDKLEVELSSPLLEGDRLEIIDGDLYHYHKMGIITYDGSDDEAHWSYGLIENGWEQDENYHAFYNYYTYNKYSLWEKLITKNSIIYCENLSTYGYNYLNSTQVSVDGIRTEGVSIGWHNVNGYDYHYMTIRIHKDKLTTIDSAGFKTWLKANPITIVYERANPYYELVKPNVGLLNAEQGLYLNILDSVVPVVNHQDLCTLKLNYLLPNVEYKVKFKANIPGSIAINLGGTLVPLDVVEGWNEVMVTTPETLVDEYLKVNGSEGIKIQNVMVIDSNKDFDYFKGMNNTFDEIPVKNICTNRTLTYTHGVDEEGVSPQGEMAVNVNKGKVVTVVGKVSNNPDNLPISINLYNDTGRATGKNLFDGKFIEDKIINTTDGAALQLNHVRGGYCTDFIEIDNTKHLTITGFCCDGIVYSCIFMYDKDKKYIGRTSGNAVGEGLRRILPTDGIDSVPGVDHTNITRNKFPNNCKYIRFSNYFTSSMNDQSTQYLLDNSTQLQIESHNGKTEYEPFRNYCNDEPIFINPDENGNFAIQIKADRDYANRIGFNVGDAFACEANDQVTITDLMVFEGDIIDCHPTTYVDPADTRYLVEYKSFGNPFGFGKNKLI